MADNDPADLLPNDRVKQAALDGEVTQLHRGNRYGEEGDTFEIDGVAFELVEVTERTLGDMTDEDAKREGSPSLSAYKERMVRAHGGNFEWDDDADVVRHRFERADEDRR
ncbi:ASCH domain-containing protein [Halorubrum ezzemoulense]|uniref:ASCH domain-containing protein n=1 Tax=Halorubrum ezzemoulense TaxID=337243 RepID=UPI00232F8AA4|nr:ASCH domain-containing protein [Halorubrum ezzemoulense]MDB2262642.1 ASCH domain-containing protein [Halorubrum ezzemoulense]MDB9300762.1 ASCH domain-containing protein [Halorubrum ezzemoulense]